MTVVGTDLKKTSKKPYFRVEKALDGAEALQFEFLVKCRTTGISNHLKLVRDTQPTSYERSLRREPRTRIHIVFI